MPSTKPAEYAGFIVCGDWTLFAVIAGNWAQTLVTRSAALDLTKTFSDCCPSVVGFINKLSVGPKVPDFPKVFATGFLVDSSGLAATNRHVIDVFNQLPTHPRTGESPLGAVSFFPADDGPGWQMLVFDVLASFPLAKFSSSDVWYGTTIPDIGFVQLDVREFPPLKLAAEEFYLRAGMEIATIGYPMGDVPLTVLGKLNQASPFIRHGIVSSVFPCPTALPHGFTIDVVQQGGSSGSPILRAADGVVVGMMSSGVQEVRSTQSQQATLTYTLNTNISIAEPAHIIQRALDEFRKSQPINIEKLPTLAERRAKYPKPDEDTGLTWESWVQRTSR
jgi:S1-C subfamily serine protease